MNKGKWYEKLHREGILSDTSFEKIVHARKKPSISVYWELATMLYLGVLLFSTGLGIVIYKNIDSIGHMAILVGIAVLSLACFIYCFATSKPFATTKVEAPNVFFDYALLLGCLLFITFISYLQYQYNSFGNRYSLPSLITLCVLFYSAYYFDHLGVLSLGITNFAAWLGITITPLHILQSNDFDNGRLILTGLLIGVILFTAGYWSKKKQLKSHFEFTYNNFAVHIFFISAIAAIIHYAEIELLLFLVLAILVVLYAWKSMKESSFYFLVVSTLYGYIGLSYIVIDYLSRNSFGITGLYFMVFYLIVSGIALARFLMFCNKKLKTQ